MMIITYFWRLRIVVIINWDFSNCLQLFVGKSNLRGTGFILTMCWFDPMLINVTWLFTWKTFKNFQNLENFDSSLKNRTLPMEDLVLLNWRTYNCFCVVINANQRFFYDDESFSTGHKKQTLTSADRVNY